MMPPRASVYLSEVFDYTVFSECENVIVYAQKMLYLMQISSFIYFVSILFSSFLSVFEDPSMF